MVFLPALFGLIVFNGAALGVAIWATIKHNSDSELEVMFAGRSIGIFVGTLSLIAMWIGGVYINGAAERMYTYGVLYVQVPVGLSLSLIVGALLFFNKMKEYNYMTLLDPFQYKYGYGYGASFFLPALFSEFFWVASIINSLGYTLKVVLGVSFIICVVISTIVVCIFTLIGGMYSVTYTNVLQLFFVIFGLSLVTPIILTNPLLDLHFIEGTSDWLGDITDDEIAIYIENMLLFIFGGIQRQVYFQRLFSLRNTNHVLIISLIAMFATLVLVIPPILIGFAAYITDWQDVEVDSDVSINDSSLIFPLVIRQLVPDVVSFFGLGAVCGAIMSAADASILGTSSLFTRNIYKRLFRPQASDKELHGVLRLAIFIITALTLVVAILWRNVYYLSTLCADIGYVILFPQLISILHFPNYLNTYGSFAAYIFAVIFRILGGEPGLGIPCLIKYPWFDYQRNIQRFPFKTSIVILSGGLLFLGSYIANKIFIDRKLNLKYDIFRVYKPLRSSIEENPPRNNRFFLYRKMSSSSNRSSVLPRNSMNYPKK